MKLKESTHAKLWKKETFEEGKENLFAKKGKKSLRGREHQNENEYANFGSGNDRFPAVRTTLPNAASRVFGELTGEGIKKGGARVLGAGENSFPGARAAGGRRL